MPGTIDSHQHFWRYNPVQYAWIDERMQRIRRDFLPDDLAPVLSAHGIDGCIAVQADQSEHETSFLLDLADKNAFIKGVVGWVDLQADDVASRLQHFAQHKKLCGIRHIVQGEEDVNFILRDNFRRGLTLLANFNLAYDVLVYPHQLGAVLSLVRQMPEQPFVIDHIAKPYIKDQFIDGWQTMMSEIAKFPNVYCKVSGMITEADWEQWRYEDFVPYLDVVFSAFGVTRTMFGSDWPVCLVAGSYSRMIELVKTYTRQLTEEAQAAFFGGNAASFYGIPR
ncbi:MAG: amidohydrolase family protein [Bacteroidota bacterium]